MNVKSVALQLHVLTDEFHQTSTAKVFEQRTAAPEDHRNK